MPVSPLIFTLNSRVCSKCFILEFTIHLQSYYSGGRNNCGFHKFFLILALILKGCFIISFTLDSPEIFSFLFLLSTKLRCFILLSRLINFKKKPIVNPRVDCGKYKLPHTLSLRQHYLYLFSLKMILQ